MEFPELFFMAETTGNLPTRTGQLNAVIKDIKKIPTPTVDSDTLVDILTKHGVELKTLTQRELKYILNGIR